GRRRLRRHSRRRRGGPDLQGFNLKTQLLSTLGTVSPVTLDCLAGGFQLNPSVENLATLGTLYFLRQEVAPVPDSLAFPVLKLSQDRSQLLTCSEGRAYNRRHPTCQT